MATDGFTTFDVNQGSANYFIAGADCQILTVALAPGEELQTEPGTMMHMATTIGTSTQVRLCDCARVCAGESCVVLTFKNKGSDQSYVALSPNFPAKVVPVNLKDLGHLVTRSGAYMTSFGGPVDLTYSCDCDFMRCCCGGMGCVRQKLAGTGTTFLAAGGTILQKTLAPGEKLLVDGHSLLGYSETVTFGVKRIGGCMEMCCGGDGLYLAELTGPGLVLVESMSFGRYKAAVRPPQDDAMQR